MPNGYYNLYTYAWENVPYTQSGIPQPGVYKSKLVAQCIQNGLNDYNVTVQPTLTMPNTLTNTRLLFLEWWDELNLAPSTGQPYFRWSSGLTIGPGVLPTWLHDYVQVYLEATMSSFVGTDNYEVQYFVNLDTDDKRVGTVVLYPTGVTTATVYHVCIVDPPKSTDLV